MKKFLSVLAILAAVAVAGYEVAEFSPADGVPFAPGVGGKLVGVEVFAPTNGTVSLSRVWSAELYTNSYSVVTNAQGTYTVAVYSNLTSHVVYTNTSDTMRGIFTRFPLMMPTDTNLSTTVTALYDISTNVLSAYERTVATNVVLVSGTASDLIYSGAPSTNVYLSKSEVLMFNGTALGGFLRLIME